MEEQAEAVEESIYPPTADNSSEQRRAHLEAENSVDLRNTLEFNLHSKITHRGGSTVRMPQCQKEVKNCDYRGNSECLVDCTYLFELTAGFAGFGELQCKHTPV